MEEKSTKLQEQHAPEKNSDNAYVRVDRDGAPATPDNKKLEITEEGHERDRNVPAPKK